VSELSREIEPQAPPGSDDGLSFEQAAREFLLHAPPPPASAQPAVASAQPALASAQPADDPARAHATRTVAALELWLDAVHVARAQRHA
jgi:hypothetical protein